MNKGVIHSICISPERGQLKAEVPEAMIIEGFGIENDGHGGDWGRQVTCLNYASVLKANAEHGLNAGPGAFAENFLLEGLDFSTLKVGSQIMLGAGAILEVSQIGKEDHPSVVTRTLGVTLLPYEGLFCRAIKGGTVRKGDPAEQIS